VQHEAGVLAPPGEEAVLEAGAGHPLEVVRGDDLVGVDVGTAQRDADPGVGGEAVHQAGASSRTGDRSAGEERVPRTAVAAATAGETRWVRPRAPWRPSKLRLEVEAQRSSGPSWSGFIPRHMEHPASRQSPPARVKTRSRPSSSACSRTACEP